METSEIITEICVALNKCQGEMHAALKDSKGFNYKYSDLSSVWSMLREPLTNNGLAVIQDAYTENDQVWISTRLIHVSGQWIQYKPLSIPIGKKDAHSTGSAITYGRRYQLCAALCIVTNDDDGAAAQANPPIAKKEKPKIDIQEWWKKAAKLTSNDARVALYVESLSSVTGKSREEIIQSLGQDDDVFKAKFKIWIEESYNKTNANKETL